MAIGSGGIDYSATWQKAAAGAADGQLGVGAQRRAQEDDGVVLKGEGIKAVSLRGIDTMTPEQAEQLASIIGQVFESLQNIVKNIAPSEQELEVLRRRIEELRQIQHDLADRKIDEELARNTLANILADEVVKKFLPALDWAVAHINV